MANLSSFTVLILVLIPMLQTAWSLECYACDNQDNNRDKCIKTSKQCEEHQDICITRMRWGLPPYWTPYGERMIFIWKDCDVLQSCEQKKADMMKHCKRDWFNDWSCIECCNGDLCNYYATMGSGHVRPSILVLAVTSLGAVIALLNR